MRGIQQGFVSVLGDSWESAADILVIALYSCCCCLFSLSTAPRRCHHVRHTPAWVSTVGSTGHAPVAARVNWSRRHVAFTFCLGTKLSSQLGGRINRACACSGPGQPGPMAHCLPAKPTNSDGQGAKLSSQLPDLSAAIATNFSQTVFGSVSFNHFRSFA